MPVAMSDQIAYAYILICSDGSLYSGYTTDLNKRMKNHNLGLGSRYTRSRLPVSLVYSEGFDNKSDAMRREFAIKQLTRAAKLDLIESHRVGQV